MATVKFNPLMTSTPLPDDWHGLELSMPEVPRINDTVTSSTGVCYVVVGVDWSQHEFGGWIATVRLR